MQQRSFGSAATALVLALSACGGGGGGGVVNSTPPPATPTPTPTPSPTPTPTPTPAPTAAVDYNSAEYQRSNAAVAAGAITAYQNGATGLGIKIGVVDSGINPALAEFSGRIDPASRDVAGDRGLSDEDGHGTAVTAVAAAAKNDSGMHGVAFNSTIVAFRADSPGSCADTSADGGCSFLDSDIAEGIDAARVAGARVINLSLGGSSPNSALLGAINRAVQAGIVLVIAAGNDGDKPEGVNPDSFALIPAQQFGSNVIIAGSVGVDAGGVTDLNQLSTFSNKAGTGQQYYLAALGYRDRTIDHTGAAYLYSGTSFSTPTISGAAALLAQAFPNLTGAKLVELLMTTADDLGAAGTDAEFGRGRLNIGRAFKPVGTTSIAGSAVAVSTSSNGELPAAAGDAAAQGPMGAIILDGYSRAFVVDLAGTLQRAEAARPLSQALGGNVRGAGAAAGPVSVALTLSQRRGPDGKLALARLGIGPEDARQARLIAGSALARIDRKTALAMGFAEGAKSLERRLSGAAAGAFLIARDIAGDPGFFARRDGSVALRRDLGPVGVTLSGERGEVWTRIPVSATGTPYNLASVAIDRKFARSWLSLGLSRLDESETLLGGRLGAVLGGGRSTSLLLDLEARNDFGNGLSAALNVRRGWTDFAGGAFRTGAYGFDLAKSGLFNAGDRLGLRLAQPLRIEQGGFELMLPSAYDYSTGGATSSLARYSLSPSGREIDAELAYGTQLGGGWLGGNLYVRRQPGHVAQAEADVGGAVRFTLGF